MSRNKAPSLESLVNQCCEDYYRKLNQTLETQHEDKDFSYERFREYITSSHCQENLKFLIEIYHYEKIWNKIFKRQSSILKCKDETTQQLQTQQQQQRKQSVATIFTNASSRRRHPSIIELPEPDEDTENSEHTEAAPEQQQRMDSIHSLDNNDINNLVNELTIPHMVTSVDDFDTRSFVDSEGPRSHFPEEQSPSPVDVVPSPIDEHDEHDDQSSDPLSSITRPLTQTHTHSSQKTNSNWDSLFKPGYQCDDTHACLCNVASHEHNHIQVPVTTTEEYEYNESVKQMEVREQLKEELGEKFEFIITCYVLNDSPYEINLPSDVYKDLVSEYENTKILYHSPLTLLPAKNAVLQLLRENIYYKFLSEQEKLISREDSERMIKESNIKISESKPIATNLAVSRTPSSNNSSLGKPYDMPRYTPVRIQEHNEVNGNLTRDLKFLRIDTPTSTNSSNSGPISSFSSFLKNHLKPPVNTTSSNVSMVSTDSSVCPSSSPSINIQRTHTFAGQTKASPIGPAKVEQSKPDQVSHSASIGDLRGAIQEKEEHGWSKLLRFKKKKDR